MIEIRAFINDGEGRFLDFEAGDRLATGPVLALPDTSDQEALDAAWLAGNRMDADRPWPATVRSLSVGDVLVLRGGPAGPTARAYAVARFGFAALDPAAVVDALAFGLPKAF
jgi:hypothetical protein